MNLLGILGSLGYVGLVLGLAALLARRGVGQEATRKLVHIALGGWWLIAMACFTSPLAAAAVPAVFVVVNLYAYRKGRLAAIQRAGPANSPGTVYYAASLLLLALFCFGPARPYMGALGVFCMAFGDGFAAVLGQRFGKRRFTLLGDQKSLAGTLVMFGASFAACLAVLALYAPAGAVWHALVLALLATLLEAVSPLGLDNLTVPLGVTGFYYAALVSGAVYQAPVAGALLSAGVVLAAWGLGLLTLPGGLGAILVGTLLYVWGGWALWVLLIWFFLSSNLASRLLARRLGGQKPKKHHGGRRLRQVLANSLPALLCVAWYAFGGSPWLLVVAAGALAACTADTWASEIGVYSRKSPVNILTLRPMQRGLSGGVSLLGLGASLAGALTTALLAMVLFYAMDPRIPTSPKAFLLVLACGMAGSLLDSLLGATIQAKFRCGASALLRESPRAGATCTLVAGVGWVSNDLVNLFSGTLVVLLALPAALLG